MVLDTSVIVSALRSPGGASRELLYRAFRTDFDLLLSSPLMLEYEDVLTRTEHLRFLTASPWVTIDTLLGAFLRVGHQIQLGAFRRPTTIDPGDEHVINLAWRGRADAIVTLNTKHFATAVRELDINCCLPGEALRLLEDTHAGD
jgi:putative PIN family toxin of toxin-antitoxin system